MLSDVSITKTNYPMKITPSFLNVALHDARSRRRLGARLSARLVPDVVHHDGGDDDAIGGTRRAAL